MDTQINLVCQSCAMPMANIEDFGTEGDDTQNMEYCRYCYQKGAFTMPDATLEHFIDKLVSMADMMGITAEQVRSMASENLPKLKRWQA